MFSVKYLSVWLSVLPNTYRYRNVILSTSSTDIRSILVEIGLPHFCWKSWTTTHQALHILSSSLSLSLSLTQTLNNSIMRWSNLLPQQCHQPIRQSRVKFFFLLCRKLKEATQRLITSQWKNGAEKTVISRFNNSKLISASWVHPQSEGRNALVCVTEGEAPYWRGVIAGGGGKNGWQMITTKKLQY